MVESFFRGRAHHIFQRKVSPPNMRGININIIMRCLIYTAHYICFIYDAFSSSVTMPYYTPPRELHTFALNYFCVWHAYSSQSKYRVSQCFNIQHYIIRLLLSCTSFSCSRCIYSFNFSIFTNVYPAQINNGNKR